MATSFMVRVGFSRRVAGPRQRDFNTPYPYRITPAYLPAETWHGTSSSIGGHSIDLAGRLSSSGTRPYLLMRYGLVCSGWWKQILSLLYPDNSVPHISQYRFRFGLPGSFLRVDILNPDDLMVWLKS